MGNQALAIGLVAGAQLAGLKAFLGSYPITPATDILQYMSLMKNYDVITCQMEDEIAGICTALGASFAGRLGMTTTSGPGLALKTETLGLAVITELPLVVVDVQRAGPSTGLPTKVEQADLLQSMFGRNSEAPVAGAGLFLPRRRLRLRGGSLPDRHPVHDAGDPAERQLHRQRRRALETAGHGRAGKVSGRVRDRSRGLLSLQAGRQAGPRLGQARHAGSVPSDRWSGEGQRDRQRQP